MAYAGERSFQRSQVIIGIRQSAGLRFRSQKPFGGALQTPHPRGESTRDQQAHEQCQDGRA